MTVALYDKLAINENILLDLPFREGIGAITHDVAKPHHLLTQHVPGGGSFTWDNLASGYPYLKFTAVGEMPADGVYLDCPAGDTVDLDFTSEDYSIGGWINWATGASASAILIGRYRLNTDGWEVYLTETGWPHIYHLSLRHHHSAGASLRTSSDSLGWTPGSWYLFGISRSGASAVHYRNGVPLDTTISEGGLIDPESNDDDLVIGTRFTKDSNWYNNMMGRIRAFGGVALSADDWMSIYQHEKGWFS